MPQANFQTASHSLPPAAATDQVRAPGQWHALPLLLYYATIFTIPFFRWRQIPLGTQQLKVDWLLVIGLALLVVPHVIIQKRIPKSIWSNIWPWFLLFLSVNIITSLLSPYPAGATEGMMVLILGMIYILINLMMVERTGLTTYLPLVLITGITINSICACLGYFGNVAYFLDGGRGIGGTIGANNSALMTVFILPLIWHRLLNSTSGFGRLWFLGLLFINMLGIVSSESRAGFLVMTATLAILAFQERHRFHPKYLGLLLAGIAVAFIVAILVTPEEYVERIQTLGQGTQADVSTQRRSAYIKVAFASFMDHPLIGTGSGTFKDVWVNSEMSLWFKRSERAAHNTYLEVMVGSGLLGLLFFGMLMLQCMRNYSSAVEICMEKNQFDLAGLNSAYRVSFISLLIYFCFKSGLDHKMFLLAVPLSQICLDVAMEAEARQPADAEGSETGMVAG